MKNQEIFSEFEELCRTAKVTPSNLSAEEYKFLMDMAEKIVMVIRQDKMRIKEGQPRIKVGGDTQHPECPCGSKTIILNNAVYECGKCGFKWTVTDQVEYGNT